MQNFNYLGEWKQWCGKVFEQVENDIILMPDEKELNFDLAFDRF